MPDFQDCLHGRTHLKDTSRNERKDPLIMKWTSLNDLRESFLSFFESKGCMRLPSFSLVPSGDKSLLLINSGMAPMKKYFTGEVTPPKSRVTTCQKCIRTPDIERVGKTARHGTYFEMLGNFSFGDYFKKEATAWAWEFFTKVLEIPADKLYISVYQDDDEAFDIWTKQNGVDPSHMVRLGKEDNFWEHGEGPCGPCSEIYFDRGEKYGCGKPTCGVGCDCDRYIEVWNLVFTQFDSDGAGNYSPLSHPNIDTGMGLERLACVMQGVDNLFEVDTVKNIMTKISTIAGINYHDDPKNDVSPRVITDHIRSSVFMVGDGVMPSNEGRGYVLRRLIRRAARHGRMIGIEGPFLYDAADAVIAENEKAYPNLAEKRDFIIKVIRSEEENFEKTIDTGMQLLSSMLENADGKVLSGDDAFKLSDTFGFPLDLTADILEEHGMTVDTQRFNELVAAQKKRARDARADAGADAWKGSDDVAKSLAKTKFLGYEQMKCSDAQIIAVIEDGKLTKQASEDRDVTVVLDKTTFYARSGGQVGDTGTISSDAFTFEVDDTVKTANGVFLHRGRVVSGVLENGMKADCAIDEQRRRSIMRNHTCAHLLQASLRKILGTHVEQAGQLVTENEVRFDFSHFSAMTPDQIRQVEDTVNNIILSAVPVTSVEMDIADARKLGAMALFGEKYGDRVRVVTAGDFSREFCAGTHVDNTARLGLFRIVSESSVAAGVRRITGVTGTNVISYINEKDKIINETANALKTDNISELAMRAAALGDELRAAEKQVAQLKAKAAAGTVGELLANAVQAGKFRFVSAVIDDAAPDEIRSMCDKAKNSPDALVMLIAGTQKQKGSVSFACACSSAAVDAGADAGAIVRTAAQTAGGNGGGKKDSAMAGGKDISKANDALDAAKEFVSKL